jgi:hypothetical protein
MSNQPTIQYRSIGEALLLQDFCPYNPASPYYGMDLNSPPAPAPEGADMSNAVLAEIVRRRNPPHTCCPVLGVFTRPLPSLRQRLVMNAAAKMIGKWVSELPLTLRTKQPDGSVTYETI